MFINLRCTLVSLKKQKEEEEESLEALFVFSFNGSEETAIADEIEEIDETEEESELLLDAADTVERERINLSRKRDCLCVIDYSVFGANSLCFLSLSSADARIFRRRQRRRRSTSRVHRTETAAAPSCSEHLTVLLAHASFLLPSACLANFLVSTTI